MLVIIVWKWERGMLNDDGGWEGDVERVKERKVVRSGIRGSDEGSQDHNQLALWVSASVLRVLNVFMECFIRAESV